MILRIVLALALCAVLAAPAGAQVVSTAAFQGKRVAAAPPVTGSLEDVKSPLWQQAFHATGFSNFTTRKPADDRTDVYLLFGPDAVYCAFVSEQRSAPIIAKQTTNNVGLGLDDYVSLMFDTSGNGTNQYFFETSPAGVRYQQASESTRYNPVWTAKGRIEGDRWIGELVIPYRFLRGSAKTWRLNFARYVAQPQYVHTWAYEPQMNSPYTVTYWPTITNTPQLANRKGQPTAQVYGLASLGTDRHVFEGAAGEFVSGKNRFVGLDAKVPLTSGLNLDLTLNPDFSNLENDQQTIAPQEFRFRYAEYRPFFTQGANYLPGSQVFYSPSIGIFDHGEKIEGQIGHFGVGLLNVGTYGSSDRAYSFAYAAPNQEFSIALSGAQAHRTYGNDSAVELSVANTNRVSQFSAGAGTALETGSFTTDASKARRSYVYSGISKANYSLQAAYYDIGPQYAPLDAFVSQSDIRGPQISGSLASTTSTTSPIRYVSVSGYADRYLDGSGAVREADTGITGSVTFKNLMTVSLGQSLGSLRGYRYDYPYYQGGVTYPYDQNTLSVSLRSGAANTGYLSYSWGPYGTLYLQQINGSVSRHFTKRLTAEFDYNHVAERPFFGTADGQTLRRLSLFGAVSRDESFSIAYRTIQGTGGFSTPGHNFAAGFYRRFGKGHTLQAEIGSPASSRTLKRYILKYVLLFGSGAGS